MKITIEADDAVDEIEDILILGQAIQNIAHRYESKADAISDPASDLPKPRGRPPKIF